MLSSEVITELSELDPLEPEWDELAVVNVFEVGLHGSLSYIVLQYMPGAHWKTYATRLARRK
jgi:hypothetical protein